MKKLILFILFAGLLLLTGQEALAQTAVPPGLAILSPQPGQALQGSIAITGSTAVEGFRAAELSFGYQDDPSQTWFLISQMDTPVNAGKLAEWDTSVLTDGDYTLRLAVTRLDNSVEAVLVMGLRVRNYTAVETNTATPFQPTSTPAPGNPVAPTATQKPTATPLPPTPTALPPNPIQMTTGEVLYNAAQGALAVAVIFGAIGLYILIRRLRL